MTPNEPTMGGEATTEELANRIITHLAALARLSHDDRPCCDLDICQHTYPIRDAATAMKTRLREQDATITAYDVVWEVRKTTIAELGNEIEQLGSKVYKLNREIKVLRQHMTKHFEASADAQLEAMKD